ncbi:hypothetical protein G6O67_005880 [Ophiocordyceps sinensis]|uniref:Ketoreductase (KR) domain-containing protein n=1 Tax=Ophiocordyceps sinensis TaxID=72228 RepID=A0A8H4PLW8_9HYPO|nr:hypothetical protein G6O67_005880 [Ophiocordyceps sinensis]
MASELRQSGQVASLVKEWQSSLPAIRGVVHAAMVLKDAFGLDSLAAIEFNWFGTDLQPPLQVLTAC